MSNKTKSSLLNAAGIIGIILAIVLITVGVVSSARNRAISLEELEEFLNKEDLTIEYFRRLTKNLIEVIQEIADKFDIEVDEEE